MGFGNKSKASLQASLPKSNYIFKVSSSVVLAANSINHVTLIFNTDVIANSAFNKASGTFTVPESGNYKFVLNCITPQVFNAIKEAHLYVKVNSTEIIDFTFALATFPNPASVEFIIPLVSADIVKLLFMCDAVLNLNAGYSLTGYKIQ